MKPYSLDLRERVVRAVNDGKRHSEIAEMFRIGVATVRRWVKLSKNGLLKPKVPIVTRPRKVDYMMVKQWVNNNPDKTLKEIGRECNTNDTAILYILRKLNITYKKTISIRGKEGRFKKGVSETNHQDKQG